jgi:hypothetical protein
MSEQGNMKTGKAQDTQNLTNLKNWRMWSFSIQEAVQ